MLLDQQEAIMEFYPALRAASLVLAGALIVSVASVGILQAKECDMPDEIAAGDSAAVRDECPNKGAEQKKQPKSTMSSTGSKPDNSRYSTDGIERYDDDKEYTGTGPKLEGRY
ncbi:hypothetical protein SQ11_10840 [Nitrosospira sp. NpAV]|nr:hypothetical protein SQ11_10840 [Nitrosospira sp. NpAV]